MKLTVEVPENVAERIHAFIARSGRLSMNGLVNRAILNELERTECDTETSRELPDLGAQVQELRKGQRALIALVDSSATILASLLRNRGRGEERSCAVD